MEQPTLTSIGSPRSIWQNDRTLTLVRWPTFALVPVLVFGLLAGLTSGLVTGLVTGVMAGLVSGVMSIWAGRHHAWLVCIIAVIPLAFAGLLPWRIMNFLEDAHRLGLLRAVGPVYQFRHAALHDHLAADHTPDPAA